MARDLGPQRSLGPFDILSDTQGVDFGPYLSRVLQSIKMQLVQPASPRKHARLC